MIGLAYLKALLSRAHYPIRGVLRVQSTALPVGLDEVDGGEVFSIGPYQHEDESGYRAYRIDPDKTISGRSPSGDWQRLVDDDDEAAGLHVYGLYDPRTYSLGCALWLVADRQNGRVTARPWAGNGADDRDSTRSPVRTGVNDVLKPFKFTFDAPDGMPPRAVFPVVAEGSVLAPVAAAEEDEQEISAAIIGRGILPSSKVVALYWTYLSTVGPLVLGMGEDETTNLIGPRGDLVTAQLSLEVVRRSDSEQVVMTELRVAFDRIPSHVGVVTYQFAIENIQDETELTITAVPEPEGVFTWSRKRPLSRTYGAPALRLEKPAEG